MHALILCNGQPPSVELLEECAEAADLVICCDGAAEYTLQMGVRIDVLAGDFDSLGKDRAEEVRKMTGCEFLEFPIRKDQTDAQIAMEYAIERGAKQLTILGALGMRFDHALSNVMLLIHAAKLGTQAVVRDEMHQIYATCTNVAVEGKIGDSLSVIPLGINSRIRLTSGLEYTMYDTDLMLGDTLSMSNRFDRETAYVEVADGWILVIKTEKSYAN